MNKESLEKIKDKIIQILNDEEIDIFDRTEIVLNLMHFLDNYESNIKVLQKNKKLTKWGNM